MDIELLSKMVGELVLDHNLVGLPGLGTFAVEDVPATFSDRGYTINPPYRNLTFRQDSPDDDTLVEFYASCNRISLDASRAILTDYLTQLGELLKERRAVTLPGLGRLRSTPDGNFFFIPAENLNIFPEGLALQPVSLKTHVETDEEVNIAVNNLQAILSGAASASMPEPAPAPEPNPVPETEPNPVPEPEPDPAPEPAPVPDLEPQTAPVPESVPEPEISGLKQYEPPFFDSNFDPYEDERSGISVPRLLFLIFALLVVVFCAFIILAQVAPDLLDKILYTKEELEIINW